MKNKKLEQGSRYEAHDLDGDGIVTDEEIAREKEMVELELREEKQMHNSVWRGSLWQACWFLQQSFFYLWFLPVVLMLSLTSLVFSILHRLALWVHTWVYRHG